MAHFSVLNDHSKKPKDRLHLKLRITEQHTAINALASACDLSKTELKKAMNSGAVWLKRIKRKQTRLRKAQYLLKPGDYLELFYDRRILNDSVAEPILLKKDPEYSIWYKPPFLLTQGTEYGDHLSLLRYAEKQLQLHNHIFLIHRLDREAFGLVILAHSKNSARHLSSQFQNRSVRKCYIAKVNGKLVPEGETFEINTALENKEAVSIVTPGTYNAEANETKVHVIIKTGRLHQIRRHLSMAGFPVSGDSRYGKKKTGSKQLKLCGCELTFSDPSTFTPVHYKLPESFISI